MAGPVPEQITNPLPASQTEFEVALPAEEASVQWLKVPLMDEVEFSPDDQTETLQTFEDAYDYVVKTGFGGQLNFTTAGRISDPVVKMLHEAGHAVSDESVLFYRIQYPDGSWRYGNFTVTRPVPQTAARGVYKYRVNGHLTGPQGWDEGTTTP